MSPFKPRAKTDPHKNGAKMYQQKIKPFNFSLRYVTGTQAWLIRGKEWLTLRACQCIREIERWKFSEKNFNSRDLVFLSFSWWFRWETLRPKYSTWAWRQISTFLIDLYTSLSYYKWGFVFLCPGKTRQFCFSEKKKLQENACKWGFKRF